MTAGRSAGVRVEGSRALRRTMRQAGQDLQQLRAAHTAAAGIASAAAASRAPRRTGALAASVRGSGTQTAAVLRAGFASVPYAAPIHWGWPARSIAPHPFLSEGAQTSESQWLPVYEVAVDAAIKKVRGI